MKNTVINIFAFAAGAAIGSIVAWKVLDAKYEKRVQEEIKSVKEAFSKKTVTSVEETVEEDVEEEQEDTINKYEKPDIFEYASKIEEQGYTNYSTNKTEKPPVEPVATDYNKPFIIPPEEFGEYEDYLVESLTYFSDGILAYDSGEIIEDIDDFVGLDSLKELDEYNDAVYVRNDNAFTDYEILLSERKYSDLYEE